MIRRTISRAFGRPITGKFSQTLPPELQAASRTHRAKAVFAELYEGFQSYFERRILAGRDDPQRHLSPIGQGLEGQQFMVHLPGSVCRVRNSMNGILWLETREEGHEERRRILSFHRDETERFRLISKEVGDGRTSFQFTSIPRLIDGVIGAVPEEQDAERADEADDMTDTESERGEDGSEIGQLVIADLGSNVPESDGEKQDIEENDEGEQ